MNKKLLSVIICVMLLAALLPCSATDAYAVMGEIKVVYDYPDRSLVIDLSNIVGDMDHWDYQLYCNSINSYNGGWLIEEGMVLDGETSVSTQVLGWGAPGDEPRYWWASIIVYNVYAEIDSCTTNIVKVDYVAPNIKIMKNPGGETITEGENTGFTAGATGYQELKWRFYYSDNKYYGMEELSTAYPGVKCSTGQNGIYETVYLSNVPLSMDGIYVTAYYSNHLGSDPKETELKGCRLRVKPGIPEITAQPKALSLETGQSGKLSVTVTEPKAGTLGYQWYRSSSPDGSNAEAVSGANSKEMTPSQSLGTVYYYCTVKNENNGLESETAKSDVVGVTYTQAKEPDPAPVPDPVPQKKDHTVLFVVAGVIVIALICATIVLVKRGKKKDRDDDYDDEDDEE